MEKMSSEGNNMSFCKNCGAELDAKWAFCPLCGEKKAPDFCPGCGRKTEADWTFCPFCGETLDAGGEKQ